WERAQVDADLDRGNNAIKATTKNVSSITFSFAPGLYPLDTIRKPAVVLDGQKLEGLHPMSDRSWTSRFQKSGGTWAAAATLDNSELHKRHGLQGPIDDAFMESFIMVRPTGKPLNEKAGAWAAAELAHATNHWRQQFRGEPRLRDDTDVSQEDIAGSNLVLWGDPQSNKLLAQILDKLPIKWDAQNVTLGKKTFAS